VAGLVDRGPCEFRMKSRQRFGRVASCREIVQETDYAKLDTFAENLLSTGLDFVSSANE
jgi:hypothetical protein